jgi:hypothetical protein
MVFFFNEIISDLAIENLILVTLMKLFPQLKQLFWTSCFLGRETVTSMPSFDFEELKF